MDGEKVQPTPISKDEYIKFKQWVQDTHGTTRGHLSTEIENALREYRQPSNERDVLHRIEQEVSTIKAQVATTESDGGADIREGSAPAPADTSKPNPNAPRSEKVGWFIGEYYNRSGGSVHVGALKSQLKDEFGFNDGVIEEYVDMVVAELDAKGHPEKDGLFAWGDKIDEIQEQYK